MTGTNDPSLESVIPLPHLGVGRFGVVIGQRWSSSLGCILQVRERRDRPESEHLVYGDNLALAVEALSRG